MSQPVERESMEVDVLFVGAGPATLASALHLMNQVEAFNRAAEAQGQQPIEPPTVLVLEKSAFPRFHVGESLLPRGQQLLIELGLIDRTRRLTHVPKLGAEFGFGHGEESTFFR